MELKQILFDTVLISSIILGLLSLLKLSRLIDYEKYIGFYAIMLAIFEVLSRVIMRIFKTTNLEGLHLYTLLEFILLSLFFYYLFKKLKIIIPIKLLTIIGSTLIICNSIFLQSFKVIPSNSHTAVNFIIIIFCLGFYVLLIKNIEEKSRFKPAIYFVTAIFIKSSLSFVIYLFSNSIMHMQPVLRDKLFIFRGVINIIAITLIFMSIILILKFRKTKNESLTINS